jgi:hypothetical protein
MIDGYVREAQNTHYTRNQFLKDLMRKANSSSATRNVIENLNKHAECDAPYTL